MQVRSDGSEFRYDGRDGPAIEEEWSALEPSPLAQVLARTLFRCRSRAALA
jgi:hypothetical protein